MPALPGNALLNQGRLNFFRLNYVKADIKKQRDTTVKITLDGVAMRVRLGSLSIKDVIADAPTTCSFIADNNNAPPPVGKRLRVTLGIDPQYLLFVGTLQTADQSYVGRPTVREWKCTATDDTPRADWMRPFGAWEGVSATTVAQQLVAAFAPGFTTNHVQLGLAPVTLYLDGTERMNGALKLIAKIIGGYFYWEDFDLHLFVGDEPGTNPDDIIDGQTQTLLDSPPLIYTTDDTQIRTRVYGKGHSEDTVTAVGANEPALAIASTVMFNAGGGKAIVESQRIAYTGTVIGGAGALVGPGVAPTAALVGAPSSGSGIETGVHAYAYTWATSTGETRPAPVASVTLGPMARPTSPPTFLGHGGPGGNNNIDPLQSGAWSPGDTVEIGYSYATSNVTTSFTPMGPTISVVAVQSPYYYHVPGDSAKSLYISLPYSLNAQVQYLQLWHRVNGGPWRWWQGPQNHPDNLNPYAWDLSNPAYYSAGGATPPVADVAFNQAALSGIAVGPTGVTARKLYRSVANASPLKLLTTLANNTATTYTDAAADATLGAAAPAGDTSGLQVAAGTVNPGDTSMVVANTAFATPSGGWAIIGNGDQVIRYAGISGNTLSGIPASGIGAIVASVNYNSTITGASMLLGVTGNAKPIREGAPVAIWVQVDDQAKQQAFAARVGGTGIVEHLIEDGRRGEPSLIALCNADLAQYGTAIVTVRYTSFDPKTRSGRYVKFSLATQLLAITLMIQEVTIDQFGAAPLTMPRFSATASNIYTSLEDLLRRMVGTLEEGF